MKLKLILTAIAGMAVALLAAVTPAQANQLPTGAKRRLEKRNLAVLCDGEGQNRTGDTTIFSRVLYQLSYLAGRRKG